MRQGCYELSVVGSDGAPFEECELDDKNFIRAEPGKEYKVKFIVHQDASGEFPYALVICALAVDGTPIDNGVALDLKGGRNQVIFSGFRVDSETIQAFMFSDLSVGTSSTSSEVTAKTGLLQVAVYEAERTEPVVNPVFTPAQLSSAARTVSENKKFWEQPSLATARGREVKEHIALASCVYERLRQLPDATIEVQCHIAGVLDFLQYQHNKLHAPSANNSSAAPDVPLHVDLSAEPDVVSAAESTKLPPVVVDLRFQDQEEVNGRKQVKIEKKRRSGRGDEYKPDADTMVVDLMQDEEEKVVEVKIEKKTKGKRKAGNRKKRAVGVGLDGRGAFKKARGAGGTDGADVEASGDVAANKD